MHPLFRWLGFILMNIGEVGNFLSYAYAPASLVAPLGTVALVANCFFAPLILHEKFRKVRVALRCPTVQISDA
jgi:hypothetical protein